MNEEQLKLLQQLLANAPKQQPDPGFAIPYKNPEDDGFELNNHNAIAKNRNGDYPDQDQVAEHVRRQQSNAYAQAADDYRNERDATLLGMDGLPLHEGRTEARRLKNEDAMYNPDAHSNTGYEGHHKQVMGDRLQTLIEQAKGNINPTGAHPLDPHTYEEKEERFKNLRRILGE